MGGEGKKPKGDRRSVSARGLSKLSAPTLPPISPASPGACAMPRACEINTTRRSCS